MGGIFDTDHDRHRGPGATTEDVPCFTPPYLSSTVSISSEIVNIEVVEVVSECCADSVGTVGIDVATVGDIGEDAFVADTVGAPPEGADVGVVETVLILSH